MESWGGVGAGGWVEGGVVIPKYYFSMKNELKVTRSEEVFYIQ